MGTDQLWVPQRSLGSYMVPLEGKLGLQVCGVEDKQSEQEKVDWALRKAKSLRPCRLVSISGGALGDLTCLCSLQGLPVYNLEM